MTKACTVPTASRIDADRIGNHVPHIPGRIIGPAKQQTVNVMEVAEACRLARFSGPRGIGNIAQEIPEDV